MNKSNDSDKKKYEESLRRRLKVLKEQFDAGKIKIAPGLKVIESLKKVRYGPDGQVDLGTVDGLVRSLALAAEFIHDREKAKELLPLADIQHAYFNFLWENFGEFYEVMVKKGLTPHDAGMALSRSPSTVTELTKNLPGFLGAIDEFWAKSSFAARAHVEDMQEVFKGIFGGDLFPSNVENIASKCGIYIDTLVLPDPFVRSRDVFGLWKPQDQAYYLIKHALNLLQYRSLACADVNPPIVVILPDNVGADLDEKKFLLRLGKQDALEHARKMFGKKFESYEDLMKYAATLDSIDQVIEKLADPNRALFDIEWKGSFKAKLERAVRGEYSELLGVTNPGRIVALNAIGRMVASNEILIKARRLRGTPIIDAPTSWQYFVWKLEYDAGNVEQETKLPDLHIVRALQNLAQHKMEWLGRVPPEALIELRKTDAIREMRTILGKGVTDLSLTDPSNFQRTSDQVFANIQAAFKEHEDKISDLRNKKWKFAGSDIGSWFVVGSLAVTAAATGLPVWGLAAVAADQLLKAPKLRDIPKSIMDLANESKKLKQSPVGMLFSFAHDR